MAGVLIRYANQETGTSEFAVDTVGEVEYLPTTTAAGTGIFERYDKVKLGSTCIVGNGSDDLLVYMLFTSGWKQI